MLKPKPVPSICPTRERKRIEQMSQNLRFNSNPRIRDRKPIARRASDLSHNFLSRKIHFPALRRKFDSIAQQVEQNLIDPRRVAVEDRVLDVILREIHVIAFALACGPMIAVSCSIISGIRMRARFSVI